MAQKRYYLQAVREMGWSRNVLLNQIKGKAYERHLATTKQHNFEKALPVHLAEQADKAMKDVYMLDFLGIVHPVLEQEIEKRMIACIRDVLLEFGNGFAFIGSQYRLSTKTKEYRVDLLFYQRKLRCLVAVDLKAGAFEPEFAGKMNFYLNLLDDTVKEPGENPPIGIILCAEKDRFDVEYALRGIDKPVGIAEYQLTSILPESLKGSLPGPAEIKKQLMKEFKRP
jgi:predicted nuclease of restriction endonuclease-like (RecB) superfamily